MKSEVRTSAGLVLRSHAAPTLMWTHLSAEAFPPLVGVLLVTCTHSYKQRSD